MKPFLFIFVGLTLTIHTFCQSYHPVPTKDAWWTESFCTSNGKCAFLKTQTIYPANNIIIDSVTYTRYNYNATVHVSEIFHCFLDDYMEYGYFYAYFRNDSLNKKVYTFDPFDSTEYLLYDFSLLVGDTMHAQSTSYLNQEILVDSIDTVDIGSGYRKKLYVHSSEGSDTWIEGIGSMRSLRYRNHQPTSCRYFICCSQFGFIYPIDANDCTAPVGIEPIPKYSAYIKQTGPNQYWINAEDGLITIRCYDTMGKVIKQEMFDQSGYLDLTQVSSGVYFMHLTYNNQSLKPYKFVISH